MQTTPLWPTNDMTKVDQMMGLGRVVVVGSGGGAWSRAVRPERKSGSEMKDLMAKISKGGQIVVDLCATATSGTASPLCGEAVPDASKAPKDCLVRD